jgi:hypothetical protein
MGPLPDDRATSQYSETAGERKKNMKAWQKICLNSLNKEFKVWGYKKRKKIHSPNIKENQMLSTSQHGRNGF